jgi:hypothetical protein
LSFILSFLSFLDVWVGAGASMIAVADRLESEVVAVAGGLLGA